MGEREEGLEGAGHLPAHVPPSMCLWGDAGIFVSQVEKPPTKPPTKLNCLDRLCCSAGLCSCRPLCLGFPPAGPSLPQSCSPPHLANASFGFCEASPDTANVGLVSLCFLYLQFLLLSTGISSLLVHAPHCTRSSLRVRT